MDKITKKAIAILKREIAKQFDDGVTIEVQLFEESESWVALVDGVAYVMQIGSDDDGFLFTTADSSEEFSFDFPEDWPV